MSFATTNKLSLTAESQIAGGAAQTEYEQTAKQYLHLTLISHVATYAFETSYFYDSDQHVGTAGQELRTQLLADDLIAYFSSLD